MQVVASPVRPAFAETYEIAGRLLLVEVPSEKIFATADRVLSRLRVLRVNHDPSIQPAAVIKLSLEKLDPPKDLVACAVTEEAHYYNNDQSYVVRLGDSVVSADASSVVRVSLAENLDCQSFWFGRILSHALGAGFRRAGAFELHCAAVVEPQSGTSALIVGPSGSGKSTLALHVAASGWDFSTDDVVLLTATDKTVAAHGLRQFFAVTSETVAHSGLSELDSLLADQKVNTVSKFPLHPQHIFPSKLVDKCVPGVLIFANRTGGPQSRIQSLSQAEVMKRLLRMCPLASFDRPVAEKFQRVLWLLTRQSRGFDLFAGTDLVKDPDYTATFLGSIVTDQAI